MRTAIVVALLLSTAACLAQGYQGSSVVVGEDADGRTIMLSVIPLKFLDPTDAANLLAAMGFPGTIMPVNPVRRPGQGFEGAYQSPYGGQQRGPNLPGRQNRSNQGNMGGYDGYQGAQQRGQQYPGYQSPYSYR